jgi:hypothetical protein
MTKFKAQDFIINDTTQLFIPVQLPYNGFFRVNPNRKGTDEIYHIVRHQNEWWLVHRAVASRYRIPRLCRSELFEAVYSDGRTLIIPVTTSLPGKEDWNLTLTAAIKSAKKRWTGLRKDDYHNCYNHSTNAPNSLLEPEWQNDDWEKLLEHAFIDRMILTVDQAEKMFPKRSHVKNHHLEDDDNDD